MSSNEEGLGDKLGKWWGGVTNKATNLGNKALGQGNFSGQAHRLGTASEQAGGTSGGQQRRPHGQQLLNSQPPNPARRPPQAAPSQAASRSRPLGIPEPNAPGPRSSSPAAGSDAAKLVPAAEFDPFTPAIGTGAALGRLHVGDEQPTAAAHPSSLGVAPPSSSSPAAAATAAAAAATHTSAPVTEAAVEEMQHSIALVLSQPVHEETLGVLYKLLSNLAASPGEPKFRQVRLSNSRITKTVVEVAGALELLQACGFVVLMEEGSAAFLDDANLGLVQEGAEQLAQVLPTAAPQPGAASTSLGGTSSSLGGASGSQQQAAESQSLTAGGASSAPDVAAAAAVAVAAVPAAAASRPAAAPAPQPTQPQAQQLQQQQPAPPPRGLQVLLPVTPDTNLPDYFFERTGADVKAEFMRLYKQRQESQVLTTRTYKEARQGAASGAAPTTTTLRIRFPEGVVLQGTFGGREPLTAVFEFVTSALRDPAACYELVTPSRRALPVTGLVREQGELLPSCLLNFRLLAEEGAGVGGAAAARRLPLLSDQMLRLARVDG